MPHSKRILISGAGITGLTLAFWLKKHGFEPVVIDRAPGPRPGADILHLFGAGYRVAEKMGLVGRIRGHDLNFGEVEFVDVMGRRTGGLGLEPLREMLDNRICHLPRGALEATLLEKIGDSIPIRYSQNIRRLDRNPDSVSVLFEDHDWSAFDLVVGADGQLSNVRRQAFGWDTLFERYCGQYVATFTLQDMHPGNRILAHATARRLVGIFGRGELSSAYLMFKSAHRLDLNETDISGQKRLVKDIFMGMGWEVDRILESMTRAPDFQFGPVSQIRMDTWAQNRVALVGDAAYCPSLLSGQGASLAMAGAYILAGELRKADGRPIPAFKAYEAKMRSVIERKQQASLKVSITPKTRLGAWASGKLVDWLGYTLVLKSVTGRLLSDPLELADY